jgi:hypothetical protein
VLQEIGTAKSIPALEKAAQSGGLTRFPAQQALNAVKRRQ